MMKYKYLRIKMDAIFEVPEREGIGTIEIDGVGNEAALKTVRMLLKHAGESTLGVRLADATYMEIGLQETPRRRRRR